MIFPAPTFHLILLLRAFGTWGDSPKPDYQPIAVTMVNYADRQQARVRQTLSSSEIAAIQYREPAEPAPQAARPDICRVSPVTDRRHHLRGACTAGVLSSQC
jgi:hypothetical protein